MGKNVPKKQLVDRQREYVRDVFGSEEISEEQRLSARAAAKVARAKRRSRKKK